MACALLFCSVCMRDSQFLIYLFIVFSKSVILFSSGGFWKEDCRAWLGSSIDNCKNQICDYDWDGNWVDNRKDYDYDWNVGSGLNGLTMSDHCCFGSMSNSGDFSSQNYTFVHKDYCWALKRLHSSFQKIIAKLETQDTP